MPYDDVIDEVLDDDEKGKEGDGEVALLSAGLSGGDCTVVASSVTTFSLSKACWSRAASSASFCSASSF